MFFENFLYRFSCEKKLGVPVVSDIIFGEVRGVRIIYEIVLENHIGHIVFIFIFAEICKVELVIGRAGHEAEILFDEGPRI